MARSYSIGILGGGTWGIALAKLLALKNYEVTVWSALSDEIDQLAKTNQHPKLPDVDLPTNLHYFSDLGKACANKDVILFATPSVFIRQTAHEARQYISNNQIVVCVAKGIEAETLNTMTDIVEEELRGS